MKGINAARTSAGAEGPSEKRVCGYFHELSNKRKRQFNPKQSDSMCASGKSNAHCLFTVELQGQKVQKQSLFFFVCPLSMVP